MLLSFCEKLLQWSILCRELIFGELKGHSLPDPDIQESHKHE